MLTGVLALTAGTAVMGCTIARTTLMRRAVQPGLLVCATQMSFSAREMVPASLTPGSVMGTQTVSTAQMSTTVVFLRPAPHLISSVTMETASTMRGSVMGTMIAGT